jgi:hypothetical protein
VFPEENYTSMGRYDEHKSVAMRKILTKSVSIFAMYFITEICSIASLAGNRKEPNESNIFKQIKNKFKEIIINERNDMYNFIVASRSGVDLSKPHIESIPKLIEERMTNEIKKLIEENSELIELNNRNVKLIHKLKKVIKTLQKRTESLDRGLAKALAAGTVSTVKPSKTADSPSPPMDSVVPPLAATSKHTRELEKLTYSGEDFEKDPDELETASSSDAGEEESSGLEQLKSDE